MATYARRHGGDGGDRPPHGNLSRIPANCESWDTQKFVGENASLFIRCLSNEVARVPFHYPSWERVPEHDKLGIYRTRGWNRGVGRKLKNVASDVSYVSNSQSQLSDMQETIRLMNENMKRMQDEIDALKSKKHDTSTESDED
ncbi:hypothetical protein R6Q57_011054 [Mikania cordata]